MDIRRTSPAKHPIAALFATLLAAWLFAMLVKPALADEALPLDVPYVSTPQSVVNKMLDMANVGKGDVVYDLGCGDGRIVITAARERGATGVGIDLNPQRIAEARGYAKKEGVSDKVKFVVGDLFHANFADATVVTLYLLPEVNRRLRPQLWKQLKAGTRVVSHDFDMGPEWPPEKIEKIGRKTLYYWTVTEANKKAVAP
jgi:SAM-dependent methyltransferase